MGKDDLHRLLNAEKQAEQNVDRAKELAKLEIKRAGEDARDQREILMVKFKTRKTSGLKEVKDKALIEAEKIRNDGNTMAKDLRATARDRIPAAVEKVLILIKDS